MKIGKRQLAEIHGNVNAAVVRALEHAIDEIIETALEGIAIDGDERIQETATWGKIQEIVADRLQTIMNKIQEGI